MKMTRFIRTTVIPASAVSLFLAGCAQQGNPGGGEGDVTPPRFLDVKPLSQSINVPVNKHVEMVFNEWVEPSSVKKAVTIHPTLKGGFTVKVDTRRVVIIPKESFAKNTTYHISVNGELTDFYRNRLVESVNCVFSTGSTIDSGVIGGGAVSGDDRDKSPLKAALFFGSRLDSTLDTTLLGEPDYLVQCDSLDRFKFESINESSYSLIAFRDKNGDNKLTPGEIVYFPRTNRVNTGVVTEIQLFKASSDTTRWKISKVVQVASTMLTATVAPSRLPDSASIVTVDSKKKIKLKTSRMLADNSTILFTAESAIPSGQYDLISWWPNRFEAGVSMPKNDSIPYTSVVSDTVRFNAVPSSDTLKTKCIGWKIVNESMRSPQLKLSWANPVNFNSTLEFTDSTGNKYPLALVWTTDTELLFKPKQDLPPSQNLSLILKPAQFSSLWGGKVTIADSLVKLKTAEDKDIALSVLVSFPNCRPYFAWNWELHSTKTSVPVIPLRFSPDGFVAEQVPAGTYLVSLFEDRNSNGKQDEGMLFPRTVGEPRVFLADTIKAKARWRTELALPTTISLFRTPAPKPVDTTKTVEKPTKGSSEPVDSTKRPAVKPSK